MSTATVRPQWSKEDDDGVHFPAQAKLGQEAKELNPRTRAVLAMNDACWRRGVGRVYIIFSNDMARAINTEEKRATLQRLTKFFYVPEAWTEAERDAWATKGWRWQTSRICVRNGWLEDTPQMPVLPLRLEVQPKKRGDPLFEALSLAKVLVYFAPLPYVAPINEIEALATMGFRNKTRTAWSYNIRGWDKLQQWKRGGMEAVIDALELHFRAHDGLVWFGTLMEVMSSIVVKEDDLKNAGGLETLAADQDNEDDES